MQNKKPSLRKEFNSFADNISKYIHQKFIDFHTFNQTVDASIGAIIDLCYEKGVFTKEEFDKDVTDKLKTQSFTRVIANSKDYEDEQLVNKIINAMNGLNIDRNHKKLQQEELKLIFGDRTDAILELLNKKLDELIIKEEIKSNA